MTGALLAAATIVVRVDAVPVSPGTAVVELVCQDGPVHARSVPFGNPASLQLPCRLSSLAVRADGYVGQTVSPVDEQAEIHVKLQKRAVLAVTEGDGDGVSVAWRPGPGQPLERARLGRALRQNSATPGDGCLAVVRPGSAPQIAPRRLSPAESISLPFKPWSQGVALGGEVLEPEGIPVAATVSVRREPDARPAGDSEVDPCEGLLDALEVTRRATERSGRFSLGPLSPGRYQLQAAADGFAAAVRAVVLPPGSPAVDVGKLVLQPVASLAVVVDPKLAAMEAPFELGVDLQQENVVLPSEEWRSVRRAEVGHELAVTFDNLSPGYYRTILSKVGTDLSFVQEVELARGVRQELILRPAPISISGTVRRRQRGVPGAEVWLRAEGIDVKATSDQQGGYSARAWTLADYAVVVTLDGDPSPYPSGHLDLRPAKPGEEVVNDIDLPAAGVVGTVLDAATGKPVEGARVKLVERRTDENLVSNMSVTTDAEGRFAFAYLTPGAQDHLEATADGYLPASAVVDTTEKADQNVIVTLDRGTKLRGWVRGPAGEPVGAATVACCAATVDGSFGASTQTDADGSFSLTLSGGSTVWAIARSYAVGWAVSGKGDMELRLPAQVPAPPIKLRNSSGDPVPRAKVTFSTESGLVMPWKCLAIHSLLNGLAAVSGDDGRLTPTGLAAGVYQAWLVSAAGMAPLGVVQVPSTSEVVVEVPSRPRK